MRKYKAIIEMPKQGVKVEEIIELSDMETENLNEREIEQHVEDLARAAIWDHVYWSYEQVDEQ